MFFFIRSVNKNKFLISLNLILEVIEGHMMSLLFKSDLNDIMKTQVFHKRFMTPKVTFMIQNYLLIKMSFSFKI